MVPLVRWEKEKEASRQIDECSDTSWHVATMFFTGKEFVILKGTI